MNYWLEALQSSLDEHGVIHDLTKEQLAAVAKDMDFAHQMHGEATGLINIPNPLRLENEKLSKELKREREKVFCRECGGRGSITENFANRSSLSSCYKCNGEGKHDP